MTSGKNKGENCGKTTEHFFIGMENFVIPYCSTHKTKYENLWKPFLEDQKEKYKRKKEEERLQFEAKLQDRKINAKFVFEQVQKAYKDTSLFVESTKNPNSTIIEEMDKVINRIFFQDAYKANLADRSITDCRLFPCDWCGYSQQEIVDELKKRGFEAFEDSAPCVIVRIPYF